MSMPEPLAEVVGEFAEVSGQDKRPCCSRFAQDLPALPADLVEAAMEQVPECQSPLFLHVDHHRPAAGAAVLQRAGRARPHAGSPPSWPRAWTGSQPRRSWRCRMTSTQTSVWPSDQPAAAARHVGDADQDQTATTRGVNDQSRRVAMQFSTSRTLVR